MQVPEILLKSKIAEMLGWLCFVVKGKAEIRDQFSNIFEPLPMHWNICVILKTKPLDNLFSK